ENTALPPTSNVEQTAVPPTSNEKTPLLPPPPQSQPYPTTTIPLKTAQGGNSVEKGLAFLHAFLIFSSLLVFSLIITAKVKDEFVTAYLKPEIPTSYGLANKLHEDAQKDYWDSKERKEYDKKLNQKSWGEMYSGVSDNQLRD
ncbi:hypothetical protein PMAYCL1PPCAC_25951, partial [Pristionchus mayeri]